MADDQPSSMAALPSFDRAPGFGSGCDHVGEEGGGGSTATANDNAGNNSGSLFPAAAAAAAAAAEGGSFMSLAMTSQQQTLVPSADCVFVVPKARRATAAQVLVVPQPSTCPSAYPTSRSRAGLLGADTESRQRLSSSSAFQPIDNNTTFSSSAARNHTMAALATLPTGSTPLAACMQLQDEEEGEISAIEVEVTTISIGGHSGHHLPDDNDMDNDDVPLLDCNEYGLDDCAGGGDDNDVDFGGREEGAPVSSSDETNDKQQSSGEESKGRSLKAPRVHKSKGSEKGSDTVVDEAPARPRLPFEHGNLKFVPLKVEKLLQTKASHALRPISLTCTPL